MFYPRPTRFDSHLFDNPIKCAAIGYDFATDGGAVGSISLPGLIPDDAIIIGGLVEVKTTFTSATDAAEVALRVESAGDVKAAIAIDDVSNPWDAGRHDIIPSWTGADSVKTTEERNLQVVVSVEDLTAGKMVVYLFYCLSRDYRYDD